jgi:hypothetical protein
VAPAAPIEAAVAAYRAALAASPESNAATYHLLRALHFRAAFTGADDALRRRLYDEGAEVGQRGVDRLEKVAARSGDSALRGDADAAEVYYWTAVCWGQWGLLRGKWASARKGVAARVRDLATRVNDLDPQLEEGGGYRLLGRLHDQAPRIPLVTGWISWRKGIEFLRRSQEIGPGNHVTWFFLAEALLAHDAQARDEALKLLEKCASALPHPEYVVEDGYYSRLARNRLQAEGVTTYK